MDIEWKNVNSISPFYIISAVAGVPEKVAASIKPYTPPLLCVRAEGFVGRQTPATRKKPGNEKM